MQFTYLAALLSLTASVTLAAPTGLSLEKRLPTQNIIRGSGWSACASTTPFLSLDNGIDFIFQGDGNVVAYDNAVAVWSSNSGGHQCEFGNSESCNLIFQDDGNFVMYANNQVVWATATEGDGYAMTFSNKAPYISIAEHNGNVLFKTS